VTTSTVKVITRLVRSATLVFAAIVAVVLTACAGETTGGVSGSAGGASEPTPAQQTSYNVVQVVDGDTIKVKDDGTTEGLRLIGIDAPESHHPTKPDECFGAEATKHLTKLIGAHKVTLQADPSQDDRDKYDRLLRYVFVGKVNINKKMITDGYATEYTYDQPYKYRDSFVAAEKSAKAHNRGLWKACEKPTTALTTTEPDTDPRFGTCTEAKDAGYGPYVRGQDPEYAWYEDRDGDGTVCG
jgi:endonuclease YncB( thermonuclease family)